MIHNDDDDTEIVQLSPLEMESSSISDIFDGVADSSSKHPFIVNKSIIKIINQWMYPPDCPEEVQMLRLDNIAIPLSYLMVGTVQGIASGVMTMYLLEIGATEAQQATILSLQSLPAAFKVLFGFLSDTMPLFGYRRKVYMGLGWLISALSIGSLVMIPTAERTIPGIALLYFMFGLGFWFADVVADSVVAEKLKLEPESRRGQLQSLCYICRFFMIMVTMTTVTVFHKAIDVNAAFSILAVLPVSLLLPSFYFFKEKRYYTQAQASASKPPPSRFQFKNPMLELTKINKIRSHNHGTKSQADSEERGEYTSISLDSRNSSTNDASTPVHSVLHSIGRRMRMGNSHHHLRGSSWDSDSDGDGGLDRELGEYPDLDVIGTPDYEDGCVSTPSTGSVSSYSYSSSLNGYSEASISTLPSISDQCADIWDTMCTQAIWQPLSFVYIYGVLQVSNVAWNQYLYTTLHFTAVEINTLLIITYILLYVGVVIYRAFLLNTNWRVIYVVCSSVSFLFSILQLLLLYGVNRSLGISDFAFSFGDNAISELFYGIQYLPTMIMMGRMCPVGTEGTSYAMFTSVNNSANMLSLSISTSLLRIWNVSSSALESHDVSGMVNLTILTSCVQLSAILFIRLLPSSVEEMENLNYNNKSAVGGGVFLFVIISSISWAVISGILNVLMPGWQGDT